MKVMQRGRRRPFREVSLMPNPYYKEIMSFYCILLYFTRTTLSIPVPYTPMYFLTFDTISLVSWPPILPLQKYISFFSVLAL